MSPSHPPFFLRVFRRFDAWLQRQRAALLRHQFATCGRNVSIQWPVVINGADHLHVGDRVSINAFVHIWAQGGVRIGDDSLIASHVAITSLTHSLAGGKYSETCLYQPIEIGRNVWIGTHAVILPGVKIGDNAVVGAGAVVTRDVAPGTVVVGIPAAPRPPGRV
jgi:maltose O-acetyltransferase